MAMNIFNLSSCDNDFIAFASWIDILQIQNKLMEVLAKGLLILSMHACVLTSAHPRPNLFFLARSLMKTSSNPESSAISASQRTRRLTKDQKI